MTFMLMALKALGPVSEFLITPSGRSLFEPSPFQVLPVVIV